MLRSSSGAALNFGEALGTTTTRDFIHKMTIVLKELKETRVSLKILEYVNYGDSQHRNDLLAESDELSAISAKMILNKKRQSNTPRK
ncbi:four helix bundle protein [Agaribacillus aureus]|uniref:four helix bundle protein n=1 Tax=Agaribacillus aureus TaxID=3051825 RepID=UPI003D1AC3AE